MPRQVFSEEMSDSGSVLFTPKWPFFIECEGSHVTTSEAYGRVGGAVQGRWLPRRDADLALTLCFRAVNSCC